MRLPWRLDLTSLAAPGSAHDLLLFTHNCTGAYAHPREASVSEDAEKALDTLFWRTSAATVGLESDVLLSLESRVRIEDVHVITSVREGLDQRRPDGAQWPGDALRGPGPAARAPRGRDRAGAAGMRRGGAAGGGAAA